MTTPPATFWSPKGRNTSLLVAMIVWPLLVAFLLIWIVSALLVNGEYVCLDAARVGGLLGGPRGLHELFRAHRRVASEVGLGLLVDRN